MLVDPIQMVGDDAEQRGLRGCGYFSGHDVAAGAASFSGAASLSGAGAGGRGFRLVRTMYPPTSGHESTASRHAP
jgi:hypothetical protein